MSDLGWWRRRRRVIVVSLVLAVVLAGYVGLRYAGAYRAGADGKAALLRAKEAIGPGDTAGARRQLQSAKVSFDQMQREIDGLGPLGPILRTVPFVRAQIKGVDAIVKAGRLLTDAGLELNEAADRVAAPGDNATSAGRILPQLAIIHTALASGATKAQAADAALHSLDNKRLLGPLNKVRSELIEKLDPVAEQARAAEKGVAAMQVFFGKNGPRRYLVFSQNPQEIRPTGGYIGAFSVMSTGSHGVTIERTSPIEDWLAAHPNVTVPTDRLGGVFQFSSQPNLANVNFLPDWTIAGSFAADLWKRGGEQPVDGVVSITPGFLRRMLEVTGPLNLPAYKETVSSDNLIDRLEFHTDQVAKGLENDRVRKSFAGDVAAAVLDHALAEPRSKWKDLAVRLGQGFDAREAMVWSPDAKLAVPLYQRGWDGTLPRGTGDFFYNAEFSFGAKNGRSLRRTFDHHVVINKDGSATVTTTMTVANVTPHDKLNPTSMAYVVAYGPTGARFSRRSVNTVTPHEVTLNGHPGAGFFVDPQPLGKARFTIAWSVANLGIDLPGHDWSYDLRFMHVPDHSGDVVNLRVDLPPGWKWKSGKPPATFTLDKDLIGSWEYRP